MKNGKIKFIMLTIILSLISLLIGYFVTLYIDKSNKSGEVDVVVTYEDTDKYTENDIKVMTQEEREKEWPYIFHIENKKDGKGLYKIYLNKLEDNSIPFNKLNYSLYLDSKLIKKGSLNDLVDNVLYKGEIKGNEKQEFKLYVWLLEEDSGTLSYEIKFDVIKDGGPGF